MTEVKSPYNFVPAPTESEVYKPEWANQVSHDIPFSDGESGEITLKITAETPIFIRNGHSRDVEENEFSHIGEGANKRYFIPATSIKGMLRNVLEIISFSRMKQVDEKPFFGLRDMNNNEYKRETNQSQLRSGWLKKEGNKWFMYPVNHVRVPMSDIERKYNILNRQLQNASDAIQKYNTLGANKNVEVRLNFVRELIKNIRGTNINYGSLYRFDTNGNFVGNIVLFGNIDNKHYDFVFAKETDIRYSVDTALIEKMDKLDDALWNYHKPSNRIPVFFKLEGDKVKHFGFSKLYRLNNGHSIGDLEPVHSYKSSKKDELDLAQLIFGAVDDISEPLKGRVFISHAFCSDNPTAQNTEERVLSSPKPSYYPFYLKQEDNKPYNTYLNNNSVLAGFKRYPVHINTKPNGNHANENIPSNFNPLPARTSFECKIRFHNLRKVELGALLSAITFHNTPNLFHNLGAAKPYGFGKVKLTILNRPKYNQYMAQFENKMNEVLKKVWIQTPQIGELFSMAKTPVSQAVDTSLNYPQLELPSVQAKDANEFVNYKKATLALTSYSLANGIVKITSLLKEAEEQRIKEIQALESCAKEALESSDFETAIECYEKLGKMNIVGFDLNAKLQEVELRKTKHLSKIEEQRRLEEVLPSDDIELITQFLKDYPLSSKKQELEMKLSNLKASSGIPERLRILTNWDNFKKEAQRWIKKVKDSGEFVKFEAEFQDVVVKIVRVQFESDKTKKVWITGTFESNHEWKRVTEWLGNERAQKLHNELTNSK
jgi:CRISPR-associated protein (TIGR03986 family)